MLRTHSLCGCRLFGAREGVAGPFSRAHTHCRSTSVDGYHHTFKPMSYYIHMHCWFSDACVCVYTYIYIYTCIYVYRNVEKQETKTKKGEERGWRRRRRKKKKPRHQRLLDSPLFFTRPSEPTALPYSNTHNGFSSFLSLSSLLLLLSRSFLFFFSFPFHRLLSPRARAAIYSNRATCSALSVCPSVYMNVYLFIRLSLSLCCMCNLYTHAYNM